MTTLENLTPPEEASTRWYISRALLAVGAAIFFITAFVDPLQGDIDFLAAVAAILLGAGIAQTGSD